MATATREVTRLRRRETVPRGGEIEVVGHRVGAGGQRPSKVVFERVGNQAFSPMWSIAAMSAESLRARPRDRRAWVRLAAAGPALP
jgi:hypothetical protein